MGCYFMDTPPTAKQVWNSVQHVKHTGAGHKDDSWLIKTFGRENIPFLKALYDNTSRYSKFVQLESMFVNRKILDGMRETWFKDGKLHPQYHQLQRNLDNLTVKVRKQEEGIKISGEITVTHDKFREIIDISEAKNVTPIEQRKKIVRESSIGQVSNL